MTLRIHTLTHDAQLDREARREVRGGFFGFLSGLYAPSPGGSGYGMNITNNIFVEYTQNIFQQNPLYVNISAGDGGIVSMGDFSPMLLSAGSPMTFVQGA